MISKIFLWLGSMNKTVVMSLMVGLIVLFLLGLVLAAIFQPQGVIMGLTMGLLFG